jgi:ferric-dicitrate binding protein FerR (iron transport regulator)
LAAAVACIVLALFIILKPKAGDVNTLTTEKGETKQVELPDGSLVILNAASTLTYSVNF